MFVNVLIDRVNVLNLGTFSFLGVGGNFLPGADANSPDSKPTRWPGKVTYHEVSPTHKPSNLNLI